MRAIVLGALFALRLAAQVDLLAVSGRDVTAEDASWVMRTSAVYNAAARSLDLGPEVRGRVDALAKEVSHASGTGNHGQALKLLHEGMAIMRGYEWTPAMSLAASLLPSLDHAVWEPGQKITLAFKRMYVPDEGAPQTLPVKLALRPLTGTLISLAELTSAGGAFTVPSSIPAGAYRLEIAMAVPKIMDMALISGYAATGISMAPGVRARCKALESRIAKLKPAPSAARTTAEYLASMFTRADRGEIRHTVDFVKEITSAEELVTALETGRDPLKARTGDLHLAYISKVDQTPQPYRLYVPKAYKEPVPLVVVLHGMGGDENVILNRQGSREFQDQADKYGWIIATPKGRGPTSLYRGDAEQDVLDVIAETRRLYRIDGRRIYLMGHSMGGFGTWSIAQNHPDLFAALAPSAGGGNPARMDAIKSIPQIVVHGDNDKTILVTQSRAMVEAARKLGTEVQYIEVPGGTHENLGPTRIPQIFEFFAAHPKKP